MYINPDYDIWFVQTLHSASFTSNGYSSSSAKKGKAIPPRKKASGGVWKKEGGMMLALGWAVAWCTRGIFGVFLPTGKHLNHTRAVSQMAPYLFPTYCILWVLVKSSATNTVSLCYPSLPKMCVSSILNMWPPYISPHIHSTITR